MDFIFMPPQPYLHFAGVWSQDVFYVHDYELVQMEQTSFMEFKLLLSQLSNVPGVEVSYDVHQRRYCIRFLTPCITTMDTNRLEYDDEA